jgi:hypothetical protein
MSDTGAKLRKSRRIARTNAAIKRQQRLAKAAGIHKPHEDQPHRYAKMHSLGCGVPKCHICGNPRLIWKQKTFQENKFFEGHRIDTKSSDND